MDCIFGTTVASFGGIVGTGSLQLSDYSPNSNHTVRVLAVFKSPTKCEPPTATPRPRSKLLVFTVLGDTLVRPSAAVWSIMASCMHFYNIKLIFLGLEAS